MLGTIRFSAKTIAVNISHVLHGRQLFDVSPGTMRRVSHLLQRGATRTYRILSLDGGGVRGIIEAMWLNELARRLDKPLSNYFDLIAGSSIGSVLACSVAMDLDMEDAVQMFLTRSREIFPSLFTTIARKLLRFRTEQLGPPLYDSKGLEKILQEIFGPARFTGDYLRTPVLIPTYNTTELAPEYLRSDHPDYSRNYVWEICRAACAAPLFFPPYSIQRNGTSHTMIDGALFSINPAGNALAEAQRIHSSLNVRPENYLVASFGTVSTNGSPKNGSHLGSMPLEWVRWLIYTIFDSSSKDANHKVLQSIGEDNLFRFQVGLPKGLDRIDNADTDNLHSLMQIAQDYIRSPEGRKLFDELVKRLIALDMAIQEATKPQPARLIA